MEDSRPSPPCEGTKVCEGSRQDLEPGKLDITYGSATEPTCGAEHDLSGSPFPSVQNKVERPTS